MQNLVLVKVFLFFIKACKRTEKPYKTAITNRHSLDLGRNYVSSTYGIHYFHFRFQSNNKILPESQNR